MPISSTSSRLCSKPDSSPDRYPEPLSLDQKLEFLLYSTLYTKLFPLYLNRKSLLWDDAGTKAETLSFHMIIQWNNIWNCGRKWNIIMATAWIQIKSKQNFAKFWRSQELLIVSVTSRAEATILFTDSDPEPQVKSHCMLFMHVHVLCFINLTIAYNLQVSWYVAWTSHSQVMWGSSSTSFVFVTTLQTLFRGVSPGCCSGWKSKLARLQWTSSHRT